MKGLWGPSTAQRAGQDPQDPLVPWSSLCWACRKHWLLRKLRQPQLEAFSTWLFYFLNSKTEGRWGPAQHHVGSSPSPCAHPHLLSCLHWEPMSQRNSWPLGCCPMCHLSWRKKRSPGQSSIRTNRQGTAGGQALAELPVSCPAQLQRVFPRPSEMTSSGWARMYHSTQAPS